MALTSTYTARGSFPGRRRPPCVRGHWGFVHGPGRKNHGRGRWERLRRPSAGLGASDLAFQDVCSMSSSPSSPGSDSGPVSWTPRASVVRLFAASACPSMQWAKIFSGTATPCPGPRRMESATCGCQFSPPVNDHPLDLAGALEDREDSGRAGSFRRSADRRSPWYQHGSSTGFPRVATVSGGHAHVAGHGHTRPKRAPQPPLTALGRELRQGTSNVYSRIRGPSPAGTPGGPPANGAKDGRERSRHHMKPVPSPGLVQMADP